ncbi:amphiphysin [Denticeps clupeoides]|uniref:amphiphysin n=1 Tax=Denticeps clupeoides TaxID=299321 RepID=UPI0010A3BF82|nr:amphiphysin-like [Denticeps clupeoides]
MAEIKTGIFAKNVQKRLNRAQEKVLQKLGKADETKDEQFEQCVINFKRQESEGFRLQREMKAYLAAVKAMQQASMNLTESLHEVYEPDWHGKDDVMTIGKSCDVLWEDFHQRLVDCSISALDMYLTKFPDLKVRVAKRSRKLIDYDSARHHLETLQTSTMRNEKKIAKAEEDLKKAQRVFDDLNVGLQDELPTLWDSRVGFYVTTFKDVSSLEAKFHREISVLCHKLYEVMNKLAEQHSDKMFTIQGAPRRKRDSGPLRLARTPTPPDDESPPGSPEASPNHLLRPTSPGPPRPKSPSQNEDLKKGPPVPPPPKVTPTRELEQEQILDLFDSSFPVTTPSAQANERPGESLLDLDFDPFKPDSATPIGQTQSPMSQALPWDLWAGNAESAQPATDAGFTANWAADFGTPAAGMEGSTGAAAPATDGWPPRRRLGSRGCTARGGHSWKRDPCCVVVGQAEQGQELGSEGGWATGEAGGVAGEPEESGGEASMPGIIFTNEFGQEIQDTTEGSDLQLYLLQQSADGTSGWGLAGQGDVEGSGSEYETAEEWGDAPGQNGGWASTDDELACVEQPGDQEAAGTGPGGFDDWGDSGDAGDAASPFPEQVPTGQSEPGGEDFSVEWDRSEQNTLVGLDVSTPLGTSETFQAAAEPASAETTQTVESFGTKDEPFGNSETDPFGTSGNDPFENSEDPFTASEKDPFENSEDPFGTSEKDPFGTLEKDPFADQGTELFGPQVPADGQGVDFVSAVGNSSGWAEDPFATENSQGWPGGWGGNGPGKNTESPSNGFAPWADFPTPTAAEAEVSSKGSWQEVSDSSGFFSSDGQGDFTAGWGSDGGQTLDPFASFASQTNPPVTRSSLVEGATAPKEPENSDLSEDEVANRRYGKLYQEIDTERDETDAAAAAAAASTAAGPAFVADFEKMTAAESPASVESAEGDQAEMPPTEAGEAEPLNSPTPDAAEDKGSPREETPTVVAKAEDETSTVEAKPEDETSKEGTAEEERMPIPSVVIEPASSNEGDDDRDGDIISPTATSDSTMSPEGQTAKDISSSASAVGMPPGFLYKVETMHDFEAANSDELELKMGDVVLVIPTDLAEDQDAGWLTGIREADWLQRGTQAQKGLFPENFTQRLE